MTTADWFGCAGLVLIAIGFVVFLRSAMNTARSAAATLFLVLFGYGLLGIAAYLQP
jgi:hypothetical protein